MISRDIDIAPLTNYKIGGKASYFFEFENVHHLRQGFRNWQTIVDKEKLEENNYFVLGGGTNILFPDEGFSGLVARNRIEFIDRITDDRIEAGSGVLVKDLNNYCIEHSLSGLEWSGGLPGTLGGAIFGNAGAFGEEMKNSILSVKSYDIHSGKTIERENAACRFGYRTSIFKEMPRGKEVILSAVLRLKREEQAEIERLTSEKILYRQNKQPLDQPNAGSTFKNINLKDCPKKLIELCKEKIKNDPFPVIPAAYLINLAGLAGRQVGDAMVSAKHPNFIVNLGHAKSADVKKLIGIIQNEIKNRFGVTLEPEVIII